MLNRDITSPRLLYLKGLLFVFCGLLAAGLLLFENPNFRTAALLALVIWCFARAYYFAFYVIEHYIDPTYRFAGLLSFFEYVIKRRESKHWAAKRESHFRWSEAIRYRPEKITHERMRITS